MAEILADLGTYLAHVDRHKPEHCAVFALDWAEPRLGGCEPFGVRGLDRMGWNRLARRAGGVEAAVRRAALAMGAKKIDPATARPGDVGLVMAPTHATRHRLRPVCAIRTRIGWAVTGRPHLTVADFEAVVAWRIPHG